MQCLWKSEFRVKETWKFQELKLKTVLALQKYPYYMIFIILWSSVQMKSKV